MSRSITAPEPAWLTDVAADVATWPPLTPEQVGTVARAFGSPLDADAGRTSYRDPTGERAVRNVMRGGEAA